MTSKIASLLVGLLVINILNSQTIFLTQDFTQTQFPPAGWTISSYNSQWTRSASNYAGGQVGEVKFTYVSANTTTRFISPVINTDKQTLLLLKFKHYLDHYASGYSIGVATSTDGTNWTSVWQTSPTGNIGPEERFIEINESQGVGSETFSFCFYVTGNLYNIDYWYIDDVVLQTALELDASLSKINIEKYIPQQAMNINFVIQNQGLQTINTLNVSYQVDDLPPVSQTFSGLNITKYQTQNLSFSEPYAAIPGERNIKVWINEVNGESDSVQTNDTIQKYFSVATQSVQRKPLYEQFTSSTCSPCANFNTNYFNSTFLANNAGNYSLIKYQMNWPGSGDPYYTVEGGQRRVYYGVSYVPMLFLDSQEGTFLNQSLLQNNLNNQLAKPAFFEILPNATIDTITKNLTVDIQINSYIKTQNTRLLVAVVEKITKQNVGGNGETQFRNVFMKFVPNSSGTIINFDTNETQTINLQINLNGTHIEEYTDLLVVSFIEDYADKIMMQSEMVEPQQLPTSITEAQNQLSIYPNPAKDFIYIDIDDNFIAEIYNYNGVLVAQHTAMSGYIDVRNLPIGMYILKIKANNKIFVEKFSIVR